MKKQMKKLCAHRILDFKHSNLKGSIDHLICRSCGQPVIRKLSKPTASDLSATPG
jgi:hypothetical protein